jgi:hypothetical protein
MAAERGSAFLLKIGDGAATPTFATVAGLKTTQLSINGDAVAITNKPAGDGANCCPAPGFDPCRLPRAGSSRGARRRGR